MCNFLVHFSINVPTTYPPEVEPHNFPPKYSCTDNSHQTVKNLHTLSFHENKTRTIVTTNSVTKQRKGQFNLFSLQIVKAVKAFLQGFLADQ